MTRIFTLANDGRWIWKVGHWYGDITPEPNLIIFTANDVWFEGWWTK